MKLRVRISERAEADLAEIWDHIAVADLRAAERVLARIRARVRELGSMPLVGHQRTDLADERHRFLGVPPYLIVYLVRIRDVVVARVVHGARNVKAVLEEE